MLLGRRRSSIGTADGFVSKRHGWDVLRGDEYCTEIGEGGEQTGWNSDAVIDRHNQRMSMRVVQEIDCAMERC